MFLEISLLTKNSMKSVGCTYLVKKKLDEKRKVFRGVRGGIEWPSSVRIAGIQTGVVRGALSDMKWFYGDTFILEKAFICFCLFHLGIYVFLK